MSFVALLHVVSAMVALVLGATVLLLRKGNSRHRLLGQVYFGSMLILNLTALLIYRLFGGFGLFHVAAVISLATVIAGVLGVRRRKPGWVDRHYYWMTFSYVGLLAGAASEAATRLPQAPFWWAVALASLVILVGGALIIFRRAGTTLAPFRAMSANPLLQRMPPWRAEP